MTSKQTASETTIQVDVAPGHETGVYYITICNLPFGSSWQELKDWLRQVCIVDHIELFRISTSGWIRLRGRDEFEKAWKYINSVDFKGRSIIASDRNRTEFIKIKELVETLLPSKNHIIVSPTPRIPQNQTASSLLQRYNNAQVASTHYQAMTQGQLFKMHAYAQCGAPSSSCQGPLGLNPIQSMIDPYYTAAVVPVESSWGTGSPREISYIERFALPYDKLQFGLPYRAEPLATVCSNLHSDTHGNAAELVDLGEYIPTKPLKILITSISQRAGPEETIAWIRRKTGPYASEIIHIGVPLQSAKKNRIRGHAYIIFNSTTAAQGAVQLLHQEVFQNRQISARFTIEGVTAGEQASPVTFNCGDESKAYKIRQNWKALEPPSQRNLGTTNKLEKSDKESKGKSEEKENKIHYVIADGSSRRLRQGL